MDGIIRNRVRLNGRQYDFEWCPDMDWIGLKPTDDKGAKMMEFKIVEQLK